MSSAARHLSVVTNIADQLLSRLAHVQRQGLGWRARCPAHGSEKNRALSVTGADDGRLLVHCFAGCEVLEILHAVGLELRDLFPERITHATTPSERRQSAKQAQWAAALDVLVFEATIIRLAAQQLCEAKPLNIGDHMRLNQAVDRVERARGVLRGR